MFRPLSWLFSNVTASRGKSKTKRTRNYRPQLEALEDRLVPSVTSITGPGPDGIIPVGKNVQINIKTSDFTDSDTTDAGDLPFTYDINWNDGTADSTGTLAASGDQLTATTSHSLAKAVSTVQFILIEQGEGGGPDNSGSEDVPINSNNVAIEINDTADRSDNIVLFDQGQPNGVQTINAKILNLTGSDGTFKLQAISVGSGAVTFPENGTSVSISAGQSKEITITPTAVSSEPFDVHINAYDASNNKVGEDDLTVVQVTIPKAIDHGDTPKTAAGMPGPARIPPRVPTDIAVNVTPDLANSAQFVTLAVNGQSAANGMVTIDGNKTENITSTGTYHVSGAVGANNVAMQTGSGNAGQLKLVVQVRGQDTIQSDGFSVSAIPSGVSFTVEQSETNMLNQGRFKRGFAVLEKVASDSGNPSDLQGLPWFEVVQEIVKIGTFLRVPSIVQTKPEFFNSQALILDTHAAPLDVIDAPGGALLDFQVIRYQDRRTRDDFVALPNSGYIIAETVTSRGPFATLTVEKRGAAVTANGLHSAAGTGFARMSFRKLVG